MVRSDSGAPKEETSHRNITMDEWFSSKATTPAESDAMSALQLEYQFHGDNLGSLWWLILQSLGFKHNGTTYELPDSAPSHCRSRSYTGAELYAQMDPFAIPQLTSPYQLFPSCPPKPENMTEEQQESQAWWRSIRDEMIFRRFRTEIEGFQLKLLPPASSSSSTQQQKQPPKSLSALTNKRRAAAKDAGAELFMRKPKRGRLSSSKNKKGAAADEEPDFFASSVTFPTIQEYIKDLSENLNMADVEKQEAFLASSFGEWKLQTILNHSLLVYGVGSKRTLLNQFADQLESEGDSVMVLDGFHRDITIEGILDLIGNSWLRGEKLFNNKYDVHMGRHLPIRPYGTFNYPVDGDASVIQRASSISRALARRVVESKRSYYLILHNIDGVGLRNSTAQEALAVLVSHSITLRGLNAVHLVASVDHVNGPALLWDSSTCAQFHWIWKDVHTYRPHIEEITQGTHTDEKASSKVLPRHRRDSHAPTEHKAIFTVLASLAPRHTEALQQLASLQANQLAAAARQNSNKTRTNKNDSSWVKYKTLYRQCQHKCVVAADEQLRRFLQELKDHGVVEQSSGDDAEVLSYRIPHAAQTLKDILEFSHNTSGR